MIKTNLLIICALLIISCNIKKDKNSEISSTHTNKNFIEINIDRLDTEKKISFSSVFKSYKLIPLETSENCLIGRIDELKVFDDTLYVLDRNIAKALFVFDNKGRFIRKIGRLGKGPGEYIIPRSFTIDNKKNRCKY